MSPSINVVDSIMGSGKTTWAINYMNSHQDERFIYITPFLDECDRIKNACHELKFASPEATYSKQASFKELISEGINIVTTHKLLSLLKIDDTDREYLAAYDYTVILDEAVEVISPVAEISKGDARLLINGGWVEVTSDGFVKWLDKDEEDGNTKRFADVKDMANAGTLMWFRESLFMWLLPIETIKAMPRLYVLTFLFEASHLKHYFDVYHLPYSKYYIDSGNLTPGQQDLTEVKQKLRNLITIYEGRLNQIGEPNGSLSATRWKNTSAANMAMKHAAVNNARNFFMNICKKKSSECLWAIYKNEDFSVKDYSTASIPFNSKATNAYANRDCLAYLVNVFENPQVRGWFEDRGCCIDQDKTALSTMLQWIWRSAIRNGNRINLFIPSLRMRTILREFLGNSAP